MQRRLIYLDNAATTWPKPPCVVRATAHALELYGANPGRGGHQLTLAASERVFACRLAHEFRDTVLILKL